MPVSPKPPKIVAVIPVYNHAATLRRVVQETLAVVPDVLVIDDGSTDAGLGVLRGLRVHTIRHGKNQGKGAALMTAAREARRMGKTHMITLDADGQHDPAEIRSFIREIRKHPESIIVGNRRFEGSGAPWLSRFGKHFSNFWLRIQTGCKVADTQCGFRAYPVFIFEGLSLAETRYAFEVEILVKAAWAGLFIKNVEVSVRYFKKDARMSHFRPFMDNLRISLLNTRLTLRALIPWPHRQILKPEAPGRRITVLHPIRSMKMLLRQNLTPKTAAASGALGIFLGTLPVMGFHTLLILAVAGYFRLNRPVAIAVSQLCAPPLVPALCIETGHFLRHGRFLTEISMETLGHQGLQRLLEWVMGSLILAPVLSVTMGGILYFLSLAVSKRLHED